MNFLFELLPLLALISAQSLDQSNEAFTIAAAQPNNRGYYASSPYTYGGYGGYNPTGGYYPPVPNYGYRGYNGYYRGHSNRYKHKYGNRHGYGYNYGKNHKYKNRYGNSNPNYGGYKNETPASNIETPVISDTSDPSSSPTGIPGTSENPGMPETPTLADPSHSISETLDTTDPSLTSSNNPSTPENTGMSEVPSSVDPSQAIPGASDTATPSSSSADIPGMPENSGTPEVPTSVNSSESLSSTSESQGVASTYSYPNGYENTQYNYYSR